MNLHNILINAKYEEKLLKRSWLFKTFSVIAILVISAILLTKYSYIIDSFSAIWPSIALSSEMPFAATFYYTFAQSAIIIFLAGTFMKKGQKLDTTEVLMVRPMSNFDYIAGKVAGIAKVFMGLNLIVLLITAFINLLVNRSPFSLFPYIFYFLTISIPTLVFMTGLSFSTINLLKNQAVAFIVLLGFIGIDSFYLTDVCYGIADVFGIFIPAIFSDLNGMADMTSFLLHRLAYFMAGTGLLFTTVACVNRLPERALSSKLHLLTGILFIAAGICTGILYVSRFDEHRSKWENYAETLKRYAYEPQMNTLSNDIVLETVANTLKAESVMKITNGTSAETPRIIIYLNPGLEVASVTENGENLGFSRDGQIVSVARTLVPADTVTLTLSYSGYIDEDACYSDVSRKFIDSTKTEPWRFGKHYAYLDEKIVLLTPESMWYPVTIPPSNPLAKYHIARDFTVFSLKVPAMEGRRAISQGQAESDSTHITFSNNLALTGISLAIADYESKSITVDSITYEICYFRGNDFFSKSFSNISDTLPALIRDKMSDLESSFGIAYPFDKLVFAETPVHFAAYPRAWKGYTEYVQPEIIFIPEKGVANNIDLHNEYNRIKNWMSREISDEASIESRMLQNGFFSLATSETARSNNWWQQSVSLHNIAPMFSGFTRYIYAYDYPVLDIALTTLQTVNTTASGFRPWQGIINNKQRANLYLETHSFQQATRDSLIAPEIFYELLKLKASQLKMYILSFIKESEFEQFTDNFYTEHAFVRTDASIFIDAFREAFGIDLSDFLNSWYTEISSPELLIADVYANEVELEDATDYMIEFKIYNPSEYDAVISATIGTGGNGGPRPAGGGMGGGGRNGGFSSDNDVYYYRIPAGTAWHGKILSETQPSNLALVYNIAKNLPTDNTISFSKIDDKTYDTIQGFFNIPAESFLFTPAGETIIDDDSPNFRIVASNTKTRLKNMLRKEDNEKYHNFEFWRTPSQWTLTAGDFCYGESVKSAYYKRKGSGANKAVWEFYAAEPGVYDISVWVGNMGGGPQRNNRDRRRSQRQEYVISNSEWEEKFSVNWNTEENGWHSAGRFDLPRGITTITLTDRTEREYVVADAIKFTLEERR